MEDKPIEVTPETLKQILQPIDPDEMEVGESFTLIVVPDTETDVQDALQLIAEILGELDMKSQLEPVVRKTTRVQAGDEEWIEEIDEDGMIGVGIKRNH